jgi:glycerol-3-phosphate acyltransferase PlsY
MFLLAINILTWVAHRKNLVRLLAGEEHHTSVKKMLKKKKAKAAK